MDGSEVMSTGKIAVKIFWRDTSKMREIFDWHEERGLQVDLGNETLYIKKVLDFKTRGLMCDVFYFDKKDDALVFKMIFGGDRV